jgi:hypothetical protein
MIDNKVSAEMTTAQFEDLMNKIGEINACLPFLVSVAPEVKKFLPKFGPKSLGFVEKAAELGAKMPEVLPKFFDHEEMRKDLELYKKLMSLSQAMDMLNEKLKDTLSEVGAEAYSAALLVYQAGRIHGKDVGSLNDVLDDLGRRFAYRGKKTPDAPK